MYNMGLLVLFLIKKKYDEDFVWRIYIDIFFELIDFIIFWWVLFLFDYYLLLIYSFCYNY